MMTIGIRGLKKHAGGTWRQGFPPIPCYCISPVRVNEQLQGDLLVLVNDYVDFDIFLTFIVITLELADVKSTSVY